LPDGAVFVGYAVHIEKSDEFLAEFVDSEEQGIIKKMWAKKPMLAQRYESIVDAYNISEQCKNSVVVGMFDIGDQIAVYTLQHDK
jgi:hypothetical protein